MFFALLSAALLSISGRPWGTPYIALVALIPALIVLQKEEKLWRGGLFSYLIGLPIAVVGFEGIVVLDPKIFYIGVLIISLWYFIPGIIFVYLKKHIGELRSFIGFALAWVATETILGSVFLWSGSGSLFAQLKRVTQGLFKAMGFELHIPIESWANPLAIGFSQVDSPLLLLAYWSGISLVSLVVILSNVTLLLAYRKKCLPLILLVMFCAPLIFISNGKLSNSKKESDELLVGVVQADIGERDLISASFSKAAQKDIVQNLSDLTTQMLSQYPNIDLVIWPESSLGFFLSYFEHDKSLFPQKPLLAGTYRDWLSFNSILFWNNDDYRYAYDKKMLVPIFESHFEEGDGYLDRIVEVRNQKIGLGICWESLYPEASRFSVDLGADILIYLSNDGFAGESTTPWYHARASSIVAIASGRSVIFASQSGPSAAYSSNGQLLSSIHKDEPYGILSVPLSKNSSKTPFVRFGNWFGWLSVWIVVLLVLLASKFKNLIKEPLTKSE